MNLIDPIHCQIPMKNKPLRMDRHDRSAALWASIKPNIAKPGFRCAVVSTPRPVLQAEPSLFIRAIISNAQRFDLAERLRIYRNTLRVCRGAQADRAAIEREIAIVETMQRMEETPLTPA